MQNRSTIIISILSLAGFAAQVNAFDQYVSPETQKLVKKGFVYTGLVGGCGVVAYQTYKLAFGKDERDEKRRAAAFRAAVVDQLRAEQEAERKKLAQDLQTQLDAAKKEMAGKVDSAAVDIAGKAKQVFASEIATFDGRLNKLDIASKQFAKLEDLKSEIEKQSKIVKKLADSITVKEEDLGGVVQHLTERVSKLEAKPDASTDKKDNVIV